MLGILIFEICILDNEIKSETRGRHFRGKMGSISLLVTTDLYHKFVVRKSEFRHIFVDDYVFDFGQILFVSLSFFE